MFLVSEKAAAADDLGDPPRRASFAGHYLAPACVSPGNARFKKRVGITTPKVFASREKRQQQLIVES
jgi:hypothetical protein